MKTKANVYLLPTSQHFNIGDYTISKVNEAPQPLLSYGIKKNEPYNCTVTNYQIYITFPQSDLEISKIKKGDSYINGRYIYLANDNYEVAKFDEKIVATTNTSLTIESPINIREIPTQYIEPDKNYPSIPKLFIEHFILEYNFGVEIKNIEIVLKNNADFDDYHGCFYDDKFVLELTNNNEIVILPIQIMYTKDEVIELCKSAFYLQHDPKWDNELSERIFNNWVETNLK
jgi:hypothetical protein